MKVCICGGGSLGIVCAGVFLSQGLEVNILTGHPDRWNKHIIVKDLEGKEYTGILNSISNNPKDVVLDADIVLLCVPGYIIENTLFRIKPYLRQNVMVGSIVSSTGFFFEAHKALSSDIVLFGFQRVPFIARQKEYGKIGELLGYKLSLNAVIENSLEVEESRQILERIFITPVNLLENYLEVSLTNSNPILHTGRLYAMWNNYDGKIYERQGLFYSEWTDDASDILLSMDSEFMQLIDTLGIKKSVIPSLLEYYESTDAHSLTTKIKSIPAFKNILNPMKKFNGGYVPDFESRYFTEDFPFGLRYIHDLAEMYCIDAPTINKVYIWGMSKINSTSKILW